MAKETIPDNPIAAQIERLQRPIHVRRRLSGAAFLLLLVVFLIAPMLASMLPSWLQVQAIGPAQSTLGRLDTLWSIGGVSSKHQPWANDCKACHSTPFKRVLDTDCLACHKSSGDHVDRKLATIKPLQEARCASCHREHYGEFGLAEQNQRYVGTQCGACHGNIAARLPDTKTQNATDFGRDHPQFRVLVRQAEGERLQRVRPDGRTPLKDKSGLKFAHDVHLDPAGVRGPGGKTNLACADCHTPSADGLGFQRVTMKDNCQSCHMLKFEAAAFNREVPHGSVEDALTTLREFYGYAGAEKLPLNARPAPGAVAVARPGKAMEAGSFASSPGTARGRAAAAAVDLFERTSCMVCHEVTRITGAGKPGTPGSDLPQWDIAPVSAAHPWMPKSQFKHASHRSAPCADCHAAAKSTSSSDVLMPDIARCRTCHTGGVPLKSKVTSDCGMCHGFHQTSHAAAPGKQP